MSGSSRTSLGVRRGQVGLLAVLCLVLISGDRSLPPADTSAASASGSATTVTSGLSSIPADLSGPVAVRIADALELINPVLAPRERMRIGTAIARYSESYDLDPDLVLAVMLVESNARPWAHSPKGAVGLMQVMPHMMQPLGFAGNLATIESNIEAGCLILSNNIRRLGVEDGISAYFWGSDIRGVAYLEKVLAAQARLKQLATS